MMLFSVVSDQNVVSPVISVSGVLSMTTLGLGRLCLKRLTSVYCSQFVGIARYLIILPRLGIQRLGT